MKSFRPFVAAPALGLASAVLVASGCSDPREDVRVTLCKDMVSAEVGPSVTINGTETETKGYEHATVRVRYSDQGREALAVCYYEYDSVDDTADMLSDPLSAYATSPSEMVVDGKKLTRSGLAEAVKQAMLTQGKELIDRAKKGIEDAVQR